MKAKLSISYVMIAAAVILLGILFVNRDRFLIAAMSDLHTDKTNLTPAQYEAEYARKEKLSKDIADGVTYEYIHEVALSNKPNMAIHSSKAKIIDKFEKGAKLKADSADSNLVTLLSYIEHHMPKSGATVASTYSDVYYTKVVMAKDGETWTYVGAQLADDAEDEMSVYYVLGD